MIEINLLPEELRAKTKKGGFDPRYALYFLPLLLALLLFLHLYLAANFLIKNYSVAVFEKKWKQLKPQLQKIENARKETGQEPFDPRITQLASQRITWSDKLNYLSDQLPYGIWFTSLSFSSKEFLLKCSVVSLQKEEMSLINTFISNLKRDKNFIKDFASLELSSVQKKEVGGFEVVDFLLTGTVKAAQK